MIDKDWLERILIAYDVYKKQQPNTKEVENFIQWLYSQYGIAYPKERLK